MNGRDPYFIYKELMIMPSIIHTKTRKDTIVVIRKQIRTLIEELSTSLIFWTVGNFPNDKNLIECQEKRQRVMRFLIN